MNMHMQIRPVVTPDFPAIIELFHELAAFQQVPERMINSVEKMIWEKEFFNCFVAETVDKKIIGYVTWFFCYFTWTGKSMHMDDLYVTPEYRGREIGTRLINQVIKHAKETGCYKLHWQVSDWNSSAIEFYKQVGATIDETKNNCDLIL